MPTPPMPPADEINNTAREVLAGSDYSLGIFSEEEISWYKYIYKLLDKIFSPINQAGEELLRYSPFLYYTSISILVLVLIALICHIIYSLFAAYSRKQLEEYSPTQTDYSNDPADLEKKAGKEASSGNYIGALRLLFRAGLLRLENGKLRRAATNREYLKRFAETEAAEPLQVFVKIIDIKWYGGGNCTIQDWDEGKKAHKSLARIAEKMLNRAQNNNQIDSLKSFS